MEIIQLYGDTMVVMLSKEEQEVLEKYGIMKQDIDITCSTLYEITSYYIHYYQEKN